MAAGTTRRLLKKEKKEEKEKISEQICHPTNQLNMESYVILSKGIILKDLPLYD